MTSITSISAFHALKTIKKSKVIDENNNFSETGWFFEIYLDFCLTRKFTLIHLFDSSTFIILLSTNF